MPHTWTQERRAAQAERICQHKPWTKSTGPRTRAGKKRASKNAFKHGGRTALIERSRKANALQSQFMEMARLLLRDSDYLAILEQDERTIMNGH